tara:strand:- start:281 stop:505 length:225 start_codon:yes stop_codon:yes gene_type:complete
MSHKGNEQSNEQKRENALEELWGVLPIYYDGDSHEAIISSFYEEVVRVEYPQYLDFVTRQDISDLVHEYTDSLR